MDTHFSSVCAFQQRTNQNFHINLLLRNASTDLSLMTKSVWLTNTERRQIEQTEIDKSTVYTVRAFSSAADDWLLPPGNSQFSQTHRPVNSNYTTQAISSTSQRWTTAWLWTPYNRVISYITQWLTTAWSLTPHNRAISSTSQWWTTAWLWTPHKGISTIKVFKHPVHQICPLFM